MQDDLKDIFDEEPLEEELDPEKRAEEGFKDNFKDQFKDRAGQLKDKAGERAKEGTKKGGEKVAKEGAKKAGEKAAEKGAEKGAEVAAGVAAPGVGTAATKAAELAAKIGEKVGFSKKTQCCISGLCCIFPVIFAFIFGFAVMGYFANKNAKPAEALEPAPGNETAPSGGGVEDFRVFLEFIWGGKVVITSDCNSPRDGGKRLHRGYDFALAGGMGITGGKPVKAVYPGKITKIETTGWEPGESLHVQNADGGAVYAYDHIVYNRSLKEGMEVQTGTLLGTVYAYSGSHLDVKKYKDPNQWYGNTVICNGNPW